MRTIFLDSRNRLDSSNHDQSGLTLHEAVVEIHGNEKGFGSYVTHSYRLRITDIVAINEAEGEHTIITRSQQKIHFRDSMGCYYVTQIKLLHSAWRNLCKEADTPKKS